MEARALARRLIGAPEEAPLFNDGSERVTAPVRLNGVRIERSRQFGDVYLALALWRGVGLEELCKRLLPMGQERVAWAKMATAGTSDDRVPGRSQRGVWGRAEAPGVRILVRAVTSVTAIRRRSSPIFGEMSRVLMRRLKRRRGDVQYGKAVQLL